MSARTCPWCGGPNLHITNVSASDRIYWEDRDCGYREVTTDSERYDYSLSKLVPQEVRIISVYKPRPPLPAYQQPAYLRYGLHQPEPVEVEQGQHTLGSIV